MSSLAFWAAVALAGIVIGLLRRGRVERLLDLPLRGGWVLLVLVAIDLVVLPRLVGIAIVEPALVWITFGVSAGLMLLALVNWTVLRPLPAWLLGLGLNATYLLANGGRGAIVRPAAFASSDALIALPEQVALPLLSAWIPLPPDGWISPGDLVLALAAVVTIQAAMRRQAA
ncbi:MAG: DUF5317 family protein [Dehalococcoidia bacterium]